jgi:hypothetical protein
VRSMMDGARWMGKFFAAKIFRAAFSPREEKAAGGRETGTDGWRAGKNAR